MSKKAPTEQKTADGSTEESTEKPPDQPWFIPNDEEQSVYRFIIAASRRARQLQAGARPAIATTSRKPTKIGMEEIRYAEVEVEIISEDAAADTEEEPII